MGDPRGQLTEFALSLPGAREDFPWGDRVVKVRNKVFVFLDAKDGESEPTTRPTGYGLGKAGWVTVPLADVPLATLRDWIEESYPGSLPRSASSPSSTGAVDNARVEVTQALSRLTLE